MNPPESTDRSPSVAGSPELWRLFVDESQDLKTVVDGEGMLLYVNETARRVYGLEPGECVGRSALEFVHEEDRGRTRASLKEWMRPDSPPMVTYLNRQKDAEGRVRHMGWTIRRLELGGRTVLASVAKDITDVQEAREETERTQGRYQALLGGMLDPVIVIDADGTIQEANESSARVFGYAPNELVGRNVKMLMVEPYRGEHDGYLEHYHRTGETGILGRIREFPALRKDGEEIQVELSVSRIDSPAGPPLFVGSFRDITGRKRQEQALIEKERRFRAIFDGEFQFVGLLDAKGRLLEVNQTAIEQTAIQPEEAIGKPFHETPWWSHCPDAQARVAEAVRRASEGEFVRFEVDVTGKDGLINIDFSVKPVLDDEGKVVLLIPEGRDITELKRAQDRELSVMRALAEIGRSASLLAHEIKNPITSVNLALRAVSKQLGADEQEILQDLVWRMQKLEKTMRRTLSLAKPLDVQVGPLDAGELFASVVQAVAPEAEEVGCRIAVETKGDDLSLEGDEGLLEEVLVNLVRNSIDAAGAEGRIRLVAESDGGVQFWRVEDNGPGLPPEVIEAVFQPFFTTKHHGTGLGLALSRKIIEAHGGRIEGYNRDEGGACFEIQLPQRQD